MHTFESRSDSRYQCPSSQPAQPPSLPTQDSNLGTSQVTSGGPGLQGTRARRDTVCHSAGSLFLTVFAVQATEYDPLPGQGIGKFTRDYTLSTGYPTISRRTLASLEPKRERPFSENINTSTPLEAICMLVWEQVRDGAGQNQAPKIPDADGR